MNRDNSERRMGVSYQPVEKPPAALAFGLGLQLAFLSVAAMVLIPTIVIRAGGGSEAYLSWALFAAVAVCGVTTMLQAIRIGRIGAGYVLITNATGASIAVSVAAIAEGGPAMLATLLLVSSFVPIVFSSCLALFRRILTPTVSGTVIMLIPVTIIPIVFGMLTDVPDGSPMSAAPLSALATLLVITGIALRATGVMRLWAPVIGVVFGSVVAGFYGLYDIGRVAEAPWFGLPEGGWPGLDLGFGPVFWTLLPGFVLVALICTVQSMSAAIAIQRVSWRIPRAVDFQAVQGTVAAAGIGNMLSALAGTLSNTTHSTSVSVVELTGVAARGVGIAAGAVFIALSFLPKALAVVLAIPGPVAAAYLTVLLVMLFVVGIKIVVQDGIDYRKSLVAGVAFCVGVGFQSGVIFPEIFSEFAGGILRNGMTTGGIVAILITLFVEVAKPRRRRIEMEFNVSTLPKIREFLEEFVSRGGWDATMAFRLNAAAEETLLTLLEQDEGDKKHQRRRLLLIVHKEDGGAGLEFVVSTDEENLQDRIALLGECNTEDLIDRDVSLRLLRHHASSVHHQKFHETDIVTVRVKASE